MITVVGLGISEESVTLRGLKRIHGAEKVILRTKKTPPSKAFSEYESLDYLYEKAANFDELNELIVDELLKLSEGVDLVYCVDGDGYKDSSVVALFKRLSSSAETSGAPESSSARTSNEEASGTNEESGNFGEKGEASLGASSATSDKPKPPKTNDVVALNRSSAAGEPSAKGSFERTSANVGNAAGANSTSANPNSTRANADITPDIIEIIPAPMPLARPSTKCTYISAYDVWDNLYPDPSIPLCVYNIDDALIAGEVKLFLMKFYDAEGDCLLLRGENATHIPLFELDRQKKYSFDTAVYLEKGNNSSLSDLIRIMKRLTAPNGCPWDKAQSHESIRINLLEEAYETVDAITEGNIPGMIEELGDVLLQVVFHADIASRSGEFALEDVVKRLNDKLIGRHTHIFGGDKAEGADGALSVWERNKMKEKQQTTFAQSVNDIPKCFPALLRAQKALKRCEKGGWGGKTDDELLALLNKFAAETTKAKGDENAVADRLGYALLLLCYIGYRAGGNCEQALLDEVARLQRQYTEFERLALLDGKDVHALTGDEYEKFMSEARKID